MAGAPRLIRREGQDNLPGLSPLLARLLTARGVASIEDIDHSLQRLQPPAGLKGLEEAVELLIKARLAGGHILVVGDYDADGATSTALVVSVLKAFGFGQVSYLVPDRFRFGYGLSAAIVEQALTLAPDLIITVDNGISSIDGIRAARAAGVDVLVTDHHLPGAELPNASAIINPNQPGCGFPGKSTAGVGVAFYLLGALRRALIETGEPAPEFNLADSLDLVALGTVADVVPLDHNNRVLVTEGIRRIRTGRARPGIYALARAAGVDARRISTRDLAFSLGPRLNAAGRLESMALGIECLLADAETADSLASQLQQLNEDRKKIETEMRGQAREALALDDNALVVGERRGICVFDERWHQGVVGIVASRLKDEWHRPVIAFARADGEELKGSARSVPGFHVRDALDAIAASYPGMIDRFGGHAMAAGLSIAPDQYDAFAEAFNELVMARLPEAALEKQVISDGSPGAYSLTDLQPLIEDQPWGQGFPEPVFDDEFEILSQRIVGSRHLKLRLQPKSGGPALDAIAFNQDRLIEDRYRRMAYRLDINRYQGRETLQLIIEHLAVVE